MATPNQIAANRMNAKKSTGPQSPEGKKKSSMNRLSHGFASSATIIPGEDPDEFKALLDSLIDEFQPATETEQILVEKMATNNWLSQRAFRLQGYAFAEQRLRSEDFSLPKELSLLIRYHSAAERAFHKAHNELVKAQNERRKSPIGFAPQEAAGPADDAPEPPVQTAVAGSISLDYADDPDTCPLSDEELEAEILREAREYLERAA